jgi:hypothetical protein
MLHCLTERSFRLRQKNDFGGQVGAITRKA